MSVEVLLTSPSEAGNYKQEVVTRSYNEKLIDESTVLLNVIYSQVLQCKSADSAVMSDFICTRQENTLVAAGSDFQYIHQC